MRISATRIVCIVVIDLLAGCRLGPLGIPATPSATPTYLPSNTPSPAPTATATRTPIPAPGGAGFLVEPLGVKFDTSLDQLEPGQYLIVQLMQDVEDDDSISRFRYVSLDGSHSGLLFSILGETSRGPQSIGPRLQLFGGRDMSSLIFLDLGAQQIMQFSFGCENTIGLADSGSTYLAYTCDTSGQIWHVVSLNDQDIESYMFQTTFGFTGLDWITADTAILDNSINEEDFGESHPPRVSCTLHASQQSVDCFQDVPDWWGLPASGVSLGFRQSG